MNSIRRLARLFLFLTLPTLARATDLPRVAVIPDSPEPSVAAFADFLSASLASASNQYTLVERAELSLLASEAEVQKLATDQRPAALAKLAKADGLIIVGTYKGNPKQPKLALRLTSTNNGLILRSLMLGDREDEYPQAAELAAGVLHFPCERLTHGNAKPPVIVSLLGIRPAFEIDRVLESTLNLAVAQQLSAQSGIAVSERWKMNNLVFERSLVDEKPQSFATGTVLLDGSYTRKDDQLEFSLRLRKAESEAGKAISLAGPANKPTELAQQIAKLVATEAGQSGEAVAWNAIEESKQYLELGWWLFKRNLLEEAIGSYETAVALGLDGQIVSGGFMLAYLNSLYDSISGVPIYRTRVDGWDQLPKLQFKQKLISAIRMSQHCIEVIEAKWGGVAQQEFSKPYSHDMILLRALAINMKVLQSICLRREQLELADEARILRALSRELLKKSERDVVADLSFRIPQLGYMFDTPEEAAADLRKRLLPESMFFLPNFDGYYLRLELWETFHNPQLWRLADWSSTDNLRGRAVWKKFIDDLLGSDCLIARSEGHAFAYQSCDDPRERGEILLSYCSLLENNFDELLTPRGQMSFACFNGYARSGAHKREQNPAYELRMAGILTRILESGKKLEPATMAILHDTVTNWCRQKDKGESIIPESIAIEIFHLVKKCIETQKLRADSSLYSRLLQGVPGSLIYYYPQIKGPRASMRPAIEGAIPIHAYKPELPGSANSQIMMDSVHMIPFGDSLLIPSIRHGILDVNLRSMSVARVIELPFPKALHIGGFTRNETSLMMNLDRRLFSTPISGDGKTWEELLIPDVKPEDPLTWYIQGTRSGFFVGSCMLEAQPAPPRRMLAGSVRDGKLKWEVSSQRRPAVNPLDKIDPHDVRSAYQNSRGNTMVLIEGGANMLLVELETGRESFSTQDYGAVLSKGEMPLLLFYDHGIQFLAALDPTLEQPRFLFQGPLGDEYVPKNWKNMRPVYDLRRPEFLGNWIAIIVSQGHIWLLKREYGDIRYDSDDPQAFRLVRMDLNGGEPIVIPLRYDVPEDIRKLKDRFGKNLERPTINFESLTATSKGLFFSGSGYNNHFRCGMSPWGRIYGDDVPALLYITWDDINAWLAKNAPKAAQPAAETAKPASR
jgi:hypothetical protein